MRRGTKDNVKISVLNKAVLNVNWHKLPHACGEQSKFLRNYSNNNKHSNNNNNNNSDSNNNNTARSIQQNKQFLYRINYSILNKSDKIVHRFKLVKTDNLN